MPETIAAGRTTAVWETPSTTVKTFTLVVAALAATYVLYADSTQVRYADNVAVEYA